MKSFSNCNSSILNLVCLTFAVIFALTPFDQAFGQINRLSNADFESGSTSWTLGSQWFIYSINNQGHNNSARYAYFGVGSDGTTPVLNGNSTIYQSVAIPSAATSASLNFWMRVTTSEVLTTAFDYLYVEVRNSSGSVLSTVATYSNRTASATGWNNYAVTLPSSYAGQTIQIAFHGTTDSNTVTVFRIDDVSLTVSVPSPSVVTTSASSITSTSATANGTVNPNGTLTNAYYDYGTTTAYGQTTSSTSVGLGTSPVSVNGLLAGLNSSTTYHYRLVATNTNGQTTYGSDATFTTSAPSLPNLTPYQSSGWSDKIVVSRSTGTNTDSSGLTTADALYLDWGVINNGTASTSIVFYSQLYVDGVLKATWNTQPPLPANGSNYVTDYSLGNLSAGQHSVQLIVDTTNSITESNESSTDNSYTKFFTVSDVPLPTVTTSAASNITSTTATINGTITADGGYGILDRRFDWGTSTPLSQAIYSTDITVSGSTFYANLTGLQPNTTYYYRAWAQNPSNLDPGFGVGWGRGTIISFTTSPPALPNLTPYQPLGWSDKIVVSRGIGTNTDSSNLTTADTLYIDLAVTNNGAAAVPASFWFALYVDGSFVKQWFNSSSLSVGHYTAAEDYSIGQLSAGSHTLQIRADNTGLVAESDETDNSYTRTITVAAVVPPPVPFTLSPGSLTQGSAPTTNGRPALTWQSVSGASLLGIYVGEAPFDENNLAFKIENISGSATSYSGIPPYPLDPSKTYVWKMKSFGSSGAASAYSSARYFNTHANVLYKPTGISPGTLLEASAPTINSTGPTLRWNPVTGANSYVVLASKYPYGKANIIYWQDAIQGTQFTIPSGSLPANTSCRWQVVAYDSQGYESLGSSVLHFKTGTAQALSLAVTSPNSGSDAYTSGSSIPVTWTMTGDTSQVSYLEVSLSQNGGASFANPQPVSASKTSASLPTSSSLNSTTMRVKVEAFNAAGVSLKSDISDANFSVTPAASPLTFHLYTPNGQTVAQGGTLSFYVDQVAGGSSPYTYTWVFGDGYPSLTGRTISRPFKSPGNVDLAVYVTDASSPAQTQAKVIQITVQGQGVGNGQTKYNIGADPLNLANGNYISNNTDLEFNGVGLKFRFRRFYNSGAYNPDAADPTETLGALGYGWRHSYEIRVTSRDSSNGRAVQWEDGHTDLYQFNGTTWTPPVGVYDTFTENPDLSVTLKTKAQLRYLFDSTGRLTAIKDRNDNTITVTYDAPGVAGKVDFVTDTVGRVIDFQYNASGRLSALVDPIGRRIEFDTDANQDLVAVRDARGKQTSYTYDGLHQLLTGTDPLGHIFVENLYGTASPYTRAVVEQWDALRQHTRLEYNFTTHVTRVFDPLCDADASRLPEIHEHDDRLRVVKITDQAGNFETYEYVDAGISKHTDKRGNASTYLYDASGNRTDSTDAEGQTTHTSYTPLNDRDTVTGPSGIKMRYFYNAESNVESIVFPYIDTLPAGRYRTSYTYYPNGLRKTQTDALGRVTQFFYDAQGNQTKVTNPRNHDTTFTFDGVGRRLSQTDPNLNTTSQTWTPTDKIATTTDARNLTVTNEYDDNDNLITITDRRSKITRFFYNAKDKLIRTLYPDNTESKIDYDALDRKWKLTDQRGKITEFRYTAAGHQDRVIDPLGQATVFATDAEGNVIQSTDADGVVAQSDYDRIGRKTRTRVILNATTLLESTTEYQAGGLIKSVTDPDGKKTSFYYDEADRLWKTIDAKSGVAEFSYNDLGKKVWFTDPKGNKTEFTYTPLDQVETEKDALGHIWTTSYDPNGNPVTIIDPKGQTITREYTVRNELKRIIYPTGTPVVFDYDEEGHPLSMVDSIGTTSTVYDDMGRPSLFTDPFGKTLGFDYDESGARKHITYPGGRQVSITYDDAGRPQTHTDWLNRVITRTYTSAGRPLGIEFPNGVKTSFSHDAAGRLSGYAHRLGTNAPFASEAYTFSNAGDITGSISDPVANPYLPPSTMTRTFGAANQLATVNGTPVVHDDNGNLTSGNLYGTGASAFTFDYEDRLLSTTLGGITISNRYDGRGQRLETTKGTDTTRFVVDPFASLSQIMAETDGSGNVSAYYFYFGGLAARVLPDGTASYYHANHQGSIVALTAGDGSITDTYLYDPFGVLMGSTGSSNNHFKYLGAHGIWDNGDGTLFARARHFHPQLGRFVSRDPLLGSDSGPQTLNRYIYALNSPLNLMDVTGLSARDMCYVTNSPAQVQEPFIDWRDLVPVYGSGRRAYNDWQKGEYGWAIGNAALAVTDVFLVKAIVTAPFKLGGMMLAKEVAVETAEVATKEVGVGYKSFSAFKRAQGTAGDGNAWHHIVEQTPGNLEKFGSEAIHNTDNLVKLPHGPGTIHNQISGYYSSKLPFTEGKTVRQWLSTQSFEEQASFGRDILQQFGFTQ